MSTQTAQSSKKNYPILKLNEISKAFPGVLANDNLSLEINKGEILAILGENGAGKSTLMKILAGIHQPDAGSIELALNWFSDSQEKTPNLEKYKIDNPRKAIQIGIGMVYQHFKLVETLSVRDNIILGKEFTKWRTPIIAQNFADQEITKLGKLYGMPIDPKAKIEDLSVGLRQRVEILKQLFRDAQLLIFDEPTAVLSPSEVDKLFETMRELKAAGKTIIFISHKLKEPLTIADRIIVMRGGKIIGETIPSESTEASLAEMLVGRKILMQMERKEISTGNIVLKVKNLTAKNLVIGQSESSSLSGEDRNVIEDISFDVKEHQIVGIAGVQGNGQTELIESLMGLRKGVKGSIKYFSKSDLNTGEEFVGKSTLKILEKAIAYIPEDRSKQGIIHEFPIYDNAWLGLLTQREKAMNYLEDTEKQKNKSKTSFLLKYILPQRLMKKFTQKVLKDFDVSTPSIDVAIRNLSGGNQQKVILGREFSKNPRLIIASQPTRGVDIGVTERVRNALITMRNQGTGILLISSDLDEILALSDHIMIFYEGKIVGQGAITDLSTLEISQLMVGGTRTSTKN